jgi:C4-dicarboxylate-specific signal transduction histidine kinase/ActR/RegA family two-component response regulator
MSISRLSMRMDIRRNVTLRNQVEQNGLLIIAVAMALIYWIFDSMVTDQFWTRLLVVVLIFTYGMMTQFLINQRREAEEALQHAHDELEERVQIRTAELSRTNEELQKEIRERKQAEEQKKRLENQLLHAQKMEAIGTLAGGIAHDFNNLLQAISGYTQLLLMRKDASDPDFSKLEVIQSSTLKASELTKQLLIFSRKMESKLKPLDLNHEVLQVCKILQRTIPRMITFDLKLSESLKVVNADSAQLEQILMNLGVNARDAMADGGSLTFQTENVYLDRGYATSMLGATPGEYILLTVADTGHGMDKETLQHIFEPFYTTKEAGKGTGLGLAIVYGIVQNHNGYIQVDSRPGGGTTFRIYFPVLKGDGLEKAEAKVQKESPRGKERILLVDDEKTVLDIGQDLLRQYGYETLLADGGEKAIEIYRQEKDRIDLVILDLIMPGMGGQKCFQELLKINPKIKVIISTGASAEEQVREAFSPHPVGFVSKPYQLKDMLEKVREILDAKLPG